MIVKPAKDKQENHYNYSNGLLGNFLQSWDSVEDFDKASQKLGKFPCEKVRLRTNQIPGVILPKYCESIFAENVKLIRDIWVGYFKINPLQIAVFEPAPDCYTFNAEIQRSEDFLDLRYSTLNMPMRPALEKSQKHVFGLEANFTLQKYLDSASLENLNYLLDLPGKSVVEVSSFDRPVGKLQWNSIFWEVRSY